MNTRRPELEDCGVTTKQYNRYLDLKWDHSRHETRCDITIVAILTILFVSGAVLGGIYVGWGLGIFFGAISLLGVVNTMQWAVFQFRNWPLRKGNILSQIKLYEEELEIYQLIQEEDEKARQEADRARRRKLHDFWMSLSGTGFERELGTLYEQFGYQVESTPTSGDEGVDLVLIKDGKKTVVQCKAHKAPVGPAIARELYGSLMHFEADSAILACTGGFTSGVRDFVREKPIELISASELVMMAGCSGDRVVCDERDNIQNTTPCPDSTPSCPGRNCGRRVRLRSGRYGKFWGCTLGVHNIPKM